MDEAIRQLSVYRDKYLANSKRIEHLEKQLGEALEELTAVRAVLRDLRRENDRLAKRLVKSQERTKELYLALRQVVSKDHPVIKRKKYVSDRR